MVAPPPEPVGPPHRHRGIAESFGTDAERYDRARPAYPQALTAAVLADSPGSDVLDVGIGTGIAARPFREAGCRVLGVEPDPRMADVARARGFEVEVARFEEWDPAGRTFDAVIAGQSWHWVDPVAGAARAALALRPGGLLALFWNAADPDPDVAAAFAEVYRQADTGLPFTPYSSPAGTAAGYASFLEPAESGIRESGAFGETRRWRFDWEATLTRDAWLDTVPTAGGHSRIAPEKLERLLAGLGAAVDAAGGSFTMHYATVAVVAHRTAPAP